MGRELLRRMREGGIEAFAREVRREWKKPFAIVRGDGSYVQGAGPQPRRAWLEGLTHRAEAFYDAAAELWGCAASAGGERLFLLLYPMEAGERAHWEERRADCRMALLLGCRMMEARREHIWRAERDIIDVLFGRRTGIREFLAASPWQFVEEQPYVVQLIFARTHQGRQKYEEVAAFLGAYTRAHDLPSLRPIYWRGHLVHIIPALQERQSFEVSLKWPEQAVSDDFRRKAEAACGVELAMGIGGLYTLPEIWRSYDEAYLAVRFRWREAQAGYVQRFCDLGYFALLLSAPREQQRQYAAGRLEILAAYDRAHRAELLPTLEFLLKHSFDWRAAAHHFGVKANALHYRMNRVEQLLDCPVTGSPHMRFELLAALKLRELLEGDAPGERGDGIC